MQRRFKYTKAFSILTPVSGLGIKTGLTGGFVKRILKRMTSRKTKELVTLIYLSIIISVGAFFCGILFSVHNAQTAKIIDDFVHWGYLYF